MVSVRSTCCVMPHADGETVSLPSVRLCPCPGLTSVLALSLSAAKRAGTFWFSNSTRLGTCLERPCSFWLQEPPAANLASGTDDVPRSWAAAFARRPRGCAGKPGGHLSVPKRHVRLQARRDHPGRSGHRSMPDGRPARVGFRWLINVICVSDTGRHGHGQAEDGAHAGGTACRIGGTRLLRQTNA